MCTQFFFSSRRRHTRFSRDWSSDVCSSDYHPNHPELAVVVGEPGNLKRGILLFKQIRDLGIPSVFVLNMMDEAEKSGIQINKTLLNERLNTNVIYTDARSGRGKIGRAHV